MTDSPRSTKFSYMFQSIGSGIGFKRVSLVTILSFLLLISCFLILSSSTEEKKPSIMLLATGGTSPTWSPDGKKIIFESCGEGGGNCDILVMDADGTNRRKLTKSLCMDMHPNWSPDGEKIAFMSTRSGAGDIYVMNVDGSSLQQLIRDLSGEVEPVWSPDGTRIAFTRISHVRGGDIYVIVLAAPTKITPSRHFKISLVHLVVLVALFVLLITAVLVSKRFQGTRNRNYG